MMRSSFGGRVKGIDLGNGDSGRLDGSTPQNAKGNLSIHDGGVYSAMPRKYHLIF
jgi:hypothetical protein